MKPSSSDSGLARWEIGVSIALMWALCSRSHRACSSSCSLRARSSPSLSVLRSPPESSNPGGSSPESNKSWVISRASSETRALEARRRLIARVLEAVDRSQAGTIAFRGEWLRARDFPLRLLRGSRWRRPLAAFAPTDALAGLCIGSVKFAAAAIALLMAFASARLVTSTPSQARTPNASPTLIRLLPDLRVRLRFSASRRLRRLVLSIGPRFVVCLNSL